MPGINEERMVQRFLDLVRIYSPSFHEADVASVLEREMETLGMVVRNDGTGPGNTGNVIGHMRGDGSGTPILLCAHMDTVEPAQGIRPVIENGVVRSDGTTILSADCKASVATILEVLHVVKEESLPHGDVEAVFTYGEEQGLVGAKNIDVSLLNARFGFVADSSNSPGAIVTEGPAQDKIAAIFHGKAAHSGVEPEKGINALRAAADALYHMPLGRIDEETTANIGVIKGGSARNVVPDRVELEGEARSRSTEKLDRQTRAMVDAMTAAAERVGARLELDVQRSYEAYRLEERSPVVKLAREAAEEAGLESRLVASGGGTDAHILNSRGIPTAVIGTGMSQPHSVEEHIALSDMVGLANHLLALIRRAAS